MISRTKYKISPTAIAELFEAANIGGVTDIAPLGAGEYNAVFSAAAGGKEYAVKIAPAEDAVVLTYEKDMMRSELFWYQQMKEHSPIAVPQIYHADFDKKLIPTNYFIMEKLPGLPLGKMEFSETEKKDSAAEMARMAAQLHKIKNDRFGYIQNGLYDDWHQAIRAMVQMLLDDCAHRGQRSRHGEKLLSFIDKYRDVLAKAECSMVYFDIWPANIICSRESGTIRYAWIDPERSFWGDRIADFVCLEMLTPLPDKKISLEAYNAAADQPVMATQEETIRYAVAQGYLGLIMEIEKYFRYSPVHFGWWRNVFVSGLLFKKAFGALDV